MSKDRKFNAHLGARGLILRPLPRSLSFALIISPGVIAEAENKETKWPATAAKCKVSRMNCHRMIRNEGRSFQASGANKNSKVLPTPTVVQCA